MDSIKLIEERLGVIPEFQEGRYYYENQLHEMMLEFAKHHVKEALEKAANNAKISGKWGSENVTLDEIATRDNDGSWMSLNVDNDSILDAYPLSNIK